MAMLSLGSHLAIFGGAAVFFDSHQTSDRRTQEHILQKGFAFSSIKRNVLIRENTKELITSWIQNRFAPKVKRDFPGTKWGKGREGTTGPMLSSRGSRGCFLYACELSQNHPVDCEGFDSPKISEARDQFVESS